MCPPHTPVPRGTLVTEKCPESCLCLQLQAVPAAGGVLYQPSGPASFAGTFSPAGSVEGSPMHTMYMSQPAPAASGPYPSIPAAAAGNGVGLGGRVGAQQPRRTPNHYPFLFLLFWCDLKLTKQSAEQYTAFFRFTLSPPTHSLF